MRPAQEGQTDNITPAVHLEFIQNHASVAASDDVGEIEAYHRALFLHHHARDMERYQQQVRIHEDHLARLDSRLQETHVRLSSVQKLVAVQVNGASDIQPSAPWNIWDRTMFFGALLGIVSLLIFGVLNISFNLLESGLVTFTESPIRAYFWAALLPVGALAVKVGWDFIERPRLRASYLWTCLALGIISVLVWVAAYATVYPTLSKSTTEQIDSLSVFDSAGNTESALIGSNAAGVKTVDAIIVGSQAIAEILLSAVLGMYMTVIYARHRPVRLSLNPLHAQWDQERVSLEQTVARERLALAEARGNITRLENQLAALVSYAKSMFQKEMALRRDETHRKELLLEKISEQLRTELAGVHGNGARTEPATRQTLTFDRENGK